MGADGFHTKTFETKIVDRRTKKKNNKYIAGIVDEIIDKQDGRPNTIESNNYKVGGAPGTASCCKTVAMQSCIAALSTSIGKLYLASGSLFEYDNPTTASFNRSKLDPGLKALTIRTCDERFSVVGSGFMHVITSLSEEATIL